MLQIPLTRQLGIDVPIIQARLCKIGGPKLAVAVSNAGGLGCSDRFVHTDVDRRNDRHVGQSRSEIPTPRSFPKRL